MDANTGTEECEGFELVDGSEPEEPTPEQKTRARLRELSNAVQKYYPFPWHVVGCADASRSVYAANDAVVAAVASATIATLIVEAGNALPGLLDTLERHDELSRGIERCEICGKTVDAGDPEAMKGWGFDEEEGCRFCPSCMEELGAPGEEEPADLAYAPTLPCEAPAEENAQEFDQAAKSEQESSDEPGIVFLEPPDAILSWKRGGK